MEDTCEEALEDTCEAALDGEWDGARDGACDGALMVDGMEEMVLGAVMVRMAERRPTVEAYSASSNLVFGTETYVGLW